MSEKVCTKCETLKPLTEFVAAPRFKSGRASLCRVCDNERSRRWYYANRERAIERTKQWQLANPERVAELQRQALSRRPKISPEEWVIRKAATKARTKANAVLYAKRWAERNPDKYRANLQRQAERKAEQARINRQVREEQLLHRDLERFRAQGVQLRGPSQQVCPVLRLYPEMFKAAQLERKRLQDRLRLDPQQRRDKVRKWKQDNPESLKLQYKRARARGKGMTLEAYSAWRAGLIEARSNRLPRLKKAKSSTCPIIRLSPEWQKIQAARDAAKARQYYWANIAKSRARVSKWKERNPGKVSQQRYRRRVTLENVECSLTSEQWQAIKIAYRNRCAYCGLRKKLTMDHVIPISKGGEHTASNIVPACQSCNSSKNARLPQVTYQPHLILG